MSRRATTRRYNTYDVHATEEFTRSVEAAYECLLEDNPAYADMWLDRVESYICGLERPAILGVTDPVHYSARYSHIRVPNTQTTLFFLVEDDQIFLITSGWSGRNWPEILRQIAPETEKQVSMLKNTSQETTD